MTISDLRAWLSMLAEAHALVPASEVLARLPVIVDRAGDDLRALTVSEAGELLGRSSSTIRAYARSGLLPGSFKQMGREWRVPPDAIRAFHRREHEAAQAAARNVTPTGSGATDLAAWRKEIDAA